VLRLASLIADMLQKIFDQILHHHNLLLSTCNSQQKCTAIPGIVTADPAGQERLSYSADSALDTLPSTLDTRSSLQFLPIIERELRVAARQSRTWWRRIVTLALGTTILAIAFFTGRSWLGPGEVGSNIFDTLVIFAFIFSLLAGPLTTSDCVSREKREGTLGLLFLTSLRSRDVVLGKLAVSSLDIVLVLTGALPLVAMPFLLGGVDLTQFGRAALTLFNVMFLSLAIGICFSSLTGSGRAALGLTLLFLLFVTLGIPLFANDVFQLESGSVQSTLFQMMSPVHAMGILMDLRSRSSQMWQYWTAMVGLQSLAWGCIGVACWRTSRSWKQAAESARTTLLKARLAILRKRIDRSRWRRRLLEHRPLAWLETRAILEPFLLWGLFVLTTGFWIFQHLRRPDRWPDEGIVFLWPLYAHYVLCLWIAIQSPRRLADDKQSGALELLLCTTLAPSNIVRGCMRGLLSRFAPLMAASLTLALYGLYFYSIQRSGHDFDVQEIVEFLLCGLVVIPVQTYSFARLGLYQGLAQGNSLRATFKLLAKIGLLPWALFITIMLGLFWFSQAVPFPRWFGEGFIFGCWIGVHLLVCLGFVAHGNWHLRRNFRVLAAQIIKPPWWKRRKNRELLEPKLIM